MKKIILSLLVFVSLAVFIFASVSVSPVSFTFNEDTSTRLNITINNTDIGQDASITIVKIILPNNFTYIDGTNGASVVATFTNNSTTLRWFNDSDFLINGTYNQSFWFNVSAAIAGDFNITVTSINSSGWSYDSNISISINDTTFPLVSFAAPVTGGNYSNSFIMNLSVDDDTPSLVYFNVTNSSGGQNGTFTASRQGASNYWNATINTSTYVEGIYNITAYVNDSNNQANNSIVASNVRFDNTNPTISSFSCTPTSVNRGSTVTCSCSGSDADSGVASTSFTASPSTSSTGTKTETCTITDRAGNTASSTADYTVTSSGSGAAVTPSFWTGTTYITTLDQFQEGYTKSIAVKERIKVKIGNEDHFVGVKSVTSTSATIEIASNPIEITLDIGEDAKADVNDDRIYDIYVILNNIVGNKADITVTKIAEEIPEGVEEAIETTGEIAGEEIAPEIVEEEKNVWIWIIGLILIIIVAIIFLKPKLVEKVKETIKPFSETEEEIKK
jgi:hypothetical protein